MIYLARLFSGNGPITQSVRRLLYQDEGQYTFTHLFGPEPLCEDFPVGLVKALGKLVPETHCSGCKFSGIRPAAQIANMKEFQAAEPFTLQCMSDMQSGYVLAGGYVAPVRGVSGDDTLFIIAFAPRNRQKVVIPKRLMPVMSCLVNTPYTKGVLVETYDNLAFLLLDPFMKFVHTCAALRWSPESGFHLVPAVEFTSVPQSVSVPASA